MCNDSCYLCTYYIYISTPCKYFPTGRCMKRIELYCAVCAIRVGDVWCIKLSCNDASTKTNLKTPTLNAISSGGDRRPSSQSSWKISNPPVENLTNDRRTDIENCPWKYNRGPRVEAMGIWGDFPNALLLFMARLRTYAVFICIIFRLCIRKLCAHKLNPRIVTVLWIW